MKQLANFSTDLTLSLNWELLGCGATTSCRTTKGNPQLAKCGREAPRWNNAKIISSYWWCRNRTPWAWHVTICPQTPLQWISLPRSLLANKSPEESSRPSWRKAGGWSECLGTGQAAGYSSRLSKWQPAGRSSIVAASSFSFHFPHILQPQPQPSCSCSAKDLERSRISIASVGWGENVSLIYVLATVCVWVCVSSCVYIKRIIFAYFFTHSDCLALLIGVFCASEIFAFCAHFYTKKKNHKNKKHHRLRLPLPLIL